MALGASFEASRAVTSGHPPAIFGTREVRSDNLDLFPKWKGALDRYFDERRLADRTCEETAFNRWHLSAWSVFLAGLQGRDPMEQIDSVNRYMNDRRYILDPRNYGVADYWATPGQFLSRDGDCEDYAIAKYMSLRSLGFDDSKLRVVVLQDLNLKLAHAVLVVFHGGTAYVLDNQIKQVVPADAVRHYQLYYSINEKYWWLHRPRTHKS